MTNEMARREWELMETEITTEYAEKMAQLNELMSPTGLPPEGEALLQSYRDLFKATRDYRRFLNQEAYNLKTKGAKR